jgi:hypothetical protein
MMEGIGFKPIMTIKVECFDKNGKLKWVEESKKEIDERELKNDSQHGTERRTRQVA